MTRHYKDFIGYYKIVTRRAGTATAYHLLTRYGMTKRIGNYKTEKGARIGLARYCGGMPQEVKQ